MTSINGAVNIAHPFLKWVGGKGHLLDEVRARYPKELGKGIDTYIEPFVGGGAVLFDLLNHFSFKKVIINDINPKLTNCYIQIRDNVEDVVRLLLEYDVFYKKLGEDLQKAFYYSQRDKFNSLGDAQGAESAALLIFLNKTCFNGLYRENSFGAFNVPRGDYVNPNICDKENLYMCSEVLQKVDVLTGDYSVALSDIGRNCFIYIDPPYRPISETSAFTAYHKAAIFDDSEQIRLAQVIEELIKKDAKVMISNSDPKNTDVNDDFFDKLYKENMIQRVPVRRLVGGRNKSVVSELLITSKYGYLTD